MIDWIDLKLNLWDFKIKLKAIIIFFELFIEISSILYKIFAWA